ncbi:CG0192-related protein [Actinoplanes philippinensis]|uniref:CG0192-related protein n=1 Tax=Actinoplanes philippinensis TaxID=35752 RepID=UPI0033E81555
MAILHKATIVPGKLELLAAWLPGRDWYDGPAVEPERVAAARFDDPEGEVGIEALIVRAGDGPLLHVPLTYRGAPLDGAGAWLVGTTEHSVLGTRWVYDAEGDPVYRAVVAEVIRSGGHEAAEELHADGRTVRREPSMRLRGSTADPGDVTGDLTVVRTVGPVMAMGATLTGTWDGGSAVLAILA